jgi:hypothetical protein
LRVWVGVYPFIVCTLICSRERLWMCHSRSCWRASLPVLRPKSRLFVLFCIVKFWIRRFAWSEWTPTGRLPAAWLQCWPRTERTGLFRSTQIRQSAVNLLWSPLRIVLAHVSFRNFFWVGMASSSSGVFFSNGIVSAVLYTASLSIPLVPCGESLLAYWLCK